MENIAGYGELALFGANNITLSYHFSVLTI